MTEIQRQDKQSLATEICYIDASHIVIAMVHDLCVTLHYNSMQNRPQIVHVFKIYFIKILFLMIKSKVTPIRYNKTDTCI